MKTKEPRSLSKHSERISWLNYDSKGERLVSSGYDKLIIIWDVKTWEPSLRLDPHSDSVTVAMFSPLGHLVSGSRDNNLLLWGTDIQDGKEFATLSGHQLTVRSIAFSHDGNLLASASSDYYVILWDVKTSVKRIKFRAHNSAVTTLQFIDIIDNNTYQLITGGRDGALNVWKIDKLSCAVMLLWSTSHGLNLDGVRVSGGDGLSRSLSAQFDQNGARIEMS